jgi:DNA repair exonuclease SbcCD ATPase subunit
MEIYRTFDEWMPGHGYYANVPVDVEMAFNDGQSSKKAEIEQLKQQITKLEFSEEDAQQYALKCKEEIEQLNRRIEEMGKLHLSITGTLLTEIEQLKARLVSFESRYTCFTCSIADSCKYAYDNYNTNGDCIAEK